MKHNAAYRINHKKGKIMAKKAAKKVVKKAVKKAAPHRKAVKAKKK
jgi:hypothetical protein